MTVPVSQPPPKAPRGFPGPAAGPWAVVVSVLLHGLALGALAWTVGLRPTLSHARDHQPRRSVTLTAVAPAPESFAPDLDPENLSLEAQPNPPEFPVESFQDPEGPPEDLDAPDLPIEFVPRPPSQPKDLTKRTPKAASSPIESAPEVVPPIDSDPQDQPDVPPEDVAPSPVDAEPDSVTTLATRVATSCPHPEYPPQAVRMKWQGTVVVTLDVRLDGTVSDVRVVQSSGRKVLDEAVLEKVRDWKLEPASRAGVSVKSELELTFRFDASGVHADQR